MDLHSTEHPQLSTTHYLPYVRPTLHAVLQGFAPTSVPRKTSVDCLVCQDTFEGSYCLHAPCGHYFCPECTAGMAKAAIAEGNEGLFPLRCCDQLLPVEEFLDLLPKPLRASVVAKLEEISVPPPERLYCPNDACSVFLGRSSEAKDVASCSKCHTAICPECKRISHSPEPCGPPAEDLLHEAKGYASDRGWKICPRCTVIVERKSGCSHMSCRCGTSFCYSCGMPQSSCSC